MYFIAFCKIQLILGAVRKRRPQRGGGELSKADVCGRGEGGWGNADVCKILGIHHKIQYIS